MHTNGSLLKSVLGVIFDSLLHSIIATLGLFENTVNKPKELCLPKNRSLSQISSSDSLLTDQLSLDDKLASTRYS